MNGYLLDTSVALLATFHSVSLSAEVRGAMEKGPNYLSVVSYWEVVLKSMKGNLKVGEPHAWWLETLEQLPPLALRPEHITGVCVLPSIHKDPFDRVLIAQATIENLTLVTTDEEIARYASNQFLVLS